MKEFKSAADRPVLERTATALRENGMETFIVANADSARRKALELIPVGAEVFTSASVTLDTTGIAKEINESGRYDAVKTKLFSMDQKIQGREMRKYGAAPDIVIGSAHAVTESGSVLAASLTGSQLPAYAYGGGVLIWVIGAQKIVKDIDEGFQRINEYVLPLESERARKAYGLPDSFNSYPSKILVFNREIQPGRVKVILVEEALGF